MQGAGRNRKRRKKCFGSGRGSRRAQRDGDVLQVRA